MANSIIIQKLSIAIAGAVIINLAIPRTRPAAAITLFQDRNFNDGLGSFCLLTTIPQLNLTMLHRN